MGLDARAVVEELVHVVLRPRHVHELVQDAELHLQLDAIDERLVRRLQVVQARVLEDQDRDVEEDDDDVDEQQVVAHFAYCSAIQAVLGVEEGVTRLYVNRRDDKLLQAEYSDLNLLVDVVYGRLRIVCRTVGPVHKDDNRDVQDKGVGEDHGQDHAEPKGAPKDQVEPRVEDERLARDYGHPTDGHKCDIEAKGMRVEHILKEEADIIRNDAVSRGEETPEVEATSALERREDDDVELDGVVECQGHERNDGRTQGWPIVRGTPSVAHGSVREIPTRSPRDNRYGGGEGTRTGLFSPTSPSLDGSVRPSCCTAPASRTRSPSPPCTMPRGTSAPRCPSASGERCLMSSGRSWGSWSWACGAWTGGGGRSGRS